MRKSQIIYGTQTGNAQEVAEKLKEGIEKAGLEVECMDMFDGDPEGLSECADVYFVVSTWGGGRTAGRFSQLLQRDQRLSRWIPEGSKVCSVRSRGLRI